LSTRTGKAIQIPEQTKRKPDPEVKRKKKQKQNRYKRRGYKVSGK
jgi:hypothetical protein